MNSLLERLMQDLSAIPGHGENAMSIAEARSLHPGSMVQIARNPSTVRCYHTLASKEHEVPHPGHTYLVLEIVLCHESAILRLENPRTRKVLEGKYGLHWIGSRT